MMYVVVGPTPGISENTTLPRDAKEGCSESELGVVAFELIKDEFQADQRWGLKLSQVVRVSYEARIARYREAYAHRTHPPRSIK